MHFSLQFIYCSFIFHAQKKNERKKNFTKQTNIFSAYTHKQFDKHTQPHSAWLENCTISHIETIRTDVHVTPCAYYAKPLTLFQNAIITIKLNEFRSKSLTFIVQMANSQLRTVNRLRTNKTIIINGKIVFRLLDGILISLGLFFALSPYICIHIYNNLQVNLLHTV